MWLRNGGVGGSRVRSRRADEGAGHPAAHHQALLAKIAQGPADGGAPNPEALHELGLARQATRCLVLARHDFGGELA
ncbi:MAG: hypothetical protein NTW21_41835 [Verrucomicrobia bacterium]|nr:hypothetical protein [Verrucomicrobiota bacterium]